MSKLRSAGRVVTFAVIVASGASAQEREPAPSTREIPSPRDMTETSDVVRTTQLVGIGVNVGLGEKLGVLADIIIDPDGGCASLAIVALEDERRIAVPFVALRRTGSADSEKSISLDASKQIVASAPSFDEKTWPTFDHAYAAKIYAHFKATPYWSDRTRDSKGGGDAASGGRKDDDKHAAPNSVAPERGASRATKSVGEAVHDRNDKGIGAIDDIVFDCASGRVAYVVIAPTGAGDRLVALPWLSLRLGATQGKACTLDAAPEKVEKAPSFEKKSWPDMSDRKWGADVFRYWDQTPYWTEHAQPRGVALRD